MKLRHGSLLILLAFAWCGARAAETARGEPVESVSVAAAANLVYALDALNAEFKHAAPDVTVTVATGASGNLVTQIKNGAPFDVFLSADLDFPQALVKAGQARRRRAS